MEDHYGMANIRQYMNGRPLFPAIPQPEEYFSGHRNLTPAHHYDLVMVLPEFCSDASAIPSASVTTTTTSGGGGGNGTSSASLNGLEMMEIGGVGGGGDGGNGRWPRQETLTLLEVRSRLDSKFKEANQKGPLWDEVSRIMSEEHGYQRSGKKCREKFENLYKYYKKTKEGKAGRQDGKNYRFFRQLEALYGETSNPTSVSETHLIGATFQYNAASKNPNQPNKQVYQPQKISESLSLSISSESDSSSSDDTDPNASDLMENDSKQKRNKRRGRRSWKAKIREFIDLQMRKMIEKQEAWFEKVMKIIEQKEQEKMLREEEWMKQEAARRDRELKFWANQRAWIEARDTSLMEVLQKLTAKELIVAELQGHSENQNENTSETMITNNLKEDRWGECEITKLIQLRTSMDQGYQQSGYSEEVMWDEIATKMVCFGHERSASMCKNKWDSINNYLVKCDKKRRDNNLRSCSYLQNNDSIYNGGNFVEANEQGILETTRLAPNESFSRFLMGNADNLWENYNMKLSKGENR